jgi:hypothetical protein
MQTKHGVELLEQVVGELDKLLVGWKRHVSSLWVLFKDTKTDANRRQLAERGKYLLYEFIREYRNASTTTIPEMFHFLTAVVMFLHCPAPNLESNLGYWQRELGLQDWKISVRLVAVGELERNTLGDIEVVSRNKTAIVRILREQDSDLARCLARSDEQLTLVHELVHLKRRISGDDWGNEAATVAETTALVRAHRRWREAAAIEGFRKPPAAPGRGSASGPLQGTELLP